MRHLLPGDPDMPSAMDLKMKPDPIPNPEVPMLSWHSPHFSLPAALPVTPLLGDPVDVLGQNQLQSKSPSQGPPVGIFRPPGLEDPQPDPDSEPEIEREAERQSTVQYHSVLRLMYRQYHPYLSLPYQYWQNRTIN